MKIENTNKTGSVGKTNKTKKSSGADTDAFNSLLEADEAGGTSAPAASASTKAATSIDALLALQGLDDDEQQKSRRQAAMRAENILDRLDDVRVGLLTGVINGQKLVDLKNAIESHRAIITDPRMAELLDEIDLRAKVELAKLEMEKKSRS